MEVTIRNKYYRSVWKGLRFKKLANGKAAGVDRITAEAYKFGGLAAKSVLSSFYNLWENANYFFCLE
jgi:hypothetical protein